MIHSLFSVIGSVHCFLRSNACSGDVCTEMKVWSAFREAAYRALRNNNNVSVSFRRRRNRSYTGIIYCWEMTIVDEAEVRHEGCIAA